MANHFKKYLEIFDKQVLNLPTVIHELSVVEGKLKPHLNWPGGISQTESRFTVVLKNRVDNKLLNRFKKAATRLGAKEVKFYLSHGLAWEEIHV